MKDNIGIRSKHPFACDSLKSPVQSVRFSDPARRKLLDSNDAQFFRMGLCQTFGKRSSAIGRGIIHEDYLVIVIILGQYLWKCSGENFCFIPGWDQDGDPRVVAKTKIHAGCNGREVAGIADDPKE